jgi:hypothetical protein
MTAHHAPASCPLNRYRWDPSRFCRLRTAFLRRFGRFGSKCADPRRIGRRLGRRAAPMERCGTRLERARMRRACSGMHAEPFRMRPERSGTDVKRSGMGRTGSGMVLKGSRMIPKRSGTVPEWFAPPRDWCGERPRRSGIRRKSYRTNRRLFVFGWERSRPIAERFVRVRKRSRRRRKGTVGSRRVALDARLRRAAKRGGLGRDELRVERGHVRFARGRRLRARTPPRCRAASRD